MKSGPLLLAVTITGCGLVNSNSLSYEYAFDAQQFMEKLGDEKAPMATVPTMACDPTVRPDPCAALQTQMPAGAAVLSCDPPTRSCVAVIDVHLPYPVDLTRQSAPVPAPVVQYGVDNVRIEKVAYWVATNTANVTIPPIDLFVASSAAKDQLDPSAKLIGSVASLAPRSPACADPADNAGDVKMLANGAPACDVTLSDSGRAAMATFVKDYKTPFQLIAHAKITARGGDPLPVGTIDFFVRPSVSFSILK
jgi:hypothetical protein